PDRVRVGLGYYGDPGPGPVDSRVPGGLGGALGRVGELVRGDAPGNGRRDGRGYLRLDNGLGPDGRKGPGYEPDPSHHAAGLERETIGPPVRLDSEGVPEFG